MKKIVKVFAAVLVLLATVFQLDQVALAAGEFEGEQAKVGVVSDNELAVWEFVADKAKEEGIDLEIVQFTDYVQPNEALANGSLDLNAFQHTAFLNDWNKANDGELEPIGLTYVSPMGAYSQKIKKLEELPEGAKIAIPNDPTNGGRALLLLQSAGLIKVDEAAGVLATVDDVTENPKNLEFEELDAAQVAISLADVDLAVINTNFAIDNDLSLKDALFVDSDNPAELNEEYKNTITVRGEDKDNKLYQHIVELYQSKDVADKIVETSNEADVAAW
ncbi:MetQ/NlpA family ABC transporter substrate-binding protein [Ignavigranum ruoffiae]|uniref:MetQ/NlpA family ABC transporter substrate-binding protein n=1 Tax=Ignavigranum ruoffiae TaxID=89093 RepID=UPI00205F614D|nr:MetQ/NlpA family ABC transporter substrate-binding protein [Ignavigranum ruoffiae]UPQ86533.1 MetQ/NlpA family ABC transporter substrate-binding protein [Ignavigranum ruoffiae]